MVTKSVSRPAHTRQPWTDAVVDYKGCRIEDPAVIGAAWSDEGADYEAYLHSRRPAPPPQPNPDPDDEPDPPATPRMYNGYEHPGPAPKALIMDAGGDDGFVKRAEREARERYEALDCKCAVCILCGPAYCPGDTILTPLTTEQARVARELLVHEGQRQAEQRDRREQLIAQQAEKAKAAGHEPRRIERAVKIVTDGELETAAAKYGTTTVGCSCPDARWRGHGGSAGTCKHKLAAIITHNVERAMQNGAHSETDSPSAQAEPAGCPTCGYPTAEAVCPVCAMVIDPLSDDVPIEVLDPAAIPVHTPEPARDAAGMIWS